MVSTVNSCSSLQSRDDRKWLRIERYEKANNVLPLPEGYNQARQIMLNGMRNRLGPIFFPGLGALAIAAASLIGWRLWRRAS